MTLSNVHGKLVRVCFMKKKKTINTKMVFICSTECETSSPERLLFSILYAENAGDTESGANGKDTERYWRRKGNGV